MGRVVVTSLFFLAISAGAAHAQGQRGKPLVRETPRHRIVRELRASNTHFEELKLYGHWAACISPNAMGSALERFAAGIFKLNIMACFSDTALNEFGSDASTLRTEQTIILPTEMLQSGEATPITLHEMFHAYSTESAAQGKDPLLDIRVTNLEEHPPEGEKNFSAEEMGGYALELRLRQLKLTEVQSLAPNERANLVDDIHTGAILGLDYSKKSVEALDAFLAVAHANPNDVMIDQTISEYRFESLKFYVDTKIPGYQSRFRIQISVQDPRALQLRDRYFDAKEAGNKVDAQETMAEIYRYIQNRAARVLAISKEMKRKFTTIAIHSEREASSIAQNKGASLEFISSVANPRRILLKEQKAWNERSTSPALTRYKEKCGIDALLKAMYAKKKGAR